MKVARKRKRSFGWFFVFAVLAGGIACGSSEIGEECDEVGSKDECEDGAVCTTDVAGTVCRRICQNDDECPADHECNGVSGTNIKACTLKASGAAGAPG